MHPIGQGWVNAHRTPSAGATPASRTAQPVTGPITAARCSPARPTTAPSRRSSGPSISGADSRSGASIATKAPRTMKAIQTTHPPRACDDEHHRLHSGVGRPHGQRSRRNHSSTGSCLSPPTQPWHSAETPQPPSDAGVRRYRRVRFAASDGSTARISPTSPSGSPAASPTSRRLVFAPSWSASTTRDHGGMRRLAARLLPRIERDTGTDGRLPRARHPRFSLCPPGATGIFADVPESSPFAPWVEQLFHDGVTGGCGGTNYCPTAPVTRAQMAVFLIKARHPVTARIPPAARCSRTSPRATGPAVTSSSCGTRGSPAGAVPDCIVRSQPFGANRWLRSWCGVQAPLALARTR